MRAAIEDVLVAGERGAPAADRLCVACLPLLGVDAAAISLIDEGESRGTFGASDAAARLLDSLQFTAGEGPCLEAAQSMVPVPSPTCIHRTNLDGRHSRRPQNDRGYELSSRCRSG